MRFLVLSDVHANLTALDAAIAAAEGRWERAVCLGDLVGYGPDPNEAVDCVRGLTNVVIRGNHDKGVAGLTDPEEFNPVARLALEWTRGADASGQSAISAQIAARADGNRRACPGPRRRPG